MNNNTFAGWIAFHPTNSQRLEITTEQAKNLWSAKQYAIKTWSLPKSKHGLLAIEPAYK